MLDSRRAPLNIGSMHKSTPVNLGIAPNFARELSGQPEQVRRSLVEQRLNLRNADTSKLDRFGIIGGEIEQPVGELEKYAEVEWVEPVGKKFAI